MRSVLGLVPLILASCATGSAPTPAPVNDEAGSVCRAGSADRFVGQTATADLGSEILAATGAKRIRWVPYGGVITMDYSPSRLTVRLDQQNRVTSASCG